jgi:hypothetical protein
MARITATGKTNCLFIFKLQSVCFIAVLSNPQLSRKVMVDESLLYGKGALISGVLKKDSVYRKYLTVHFFICVGINLAL